MKRISLFVLFICTIFSCLSAQTGKENERIKQNYIRSIIGMDEEKQPYLQLLSKIPPEKEVSDQNVIELQQLYPIRQEEIHRLISTIRGDGSWPDINYADTKRSGWEPKQHTERILKLTKYYAREQDFRSSQHHPSGYEVLVRPKAGLQKLVVQSDRYSPHLGSGLPPFRNRNDGERKTRGHPGDGTITVWHDRTK